MSAEAIAEAVAEASYDGLSDVGLTSREDGPAVESKEGEPSVSSEKYGPAMDSEDGKPAEDSKEGEPAMDSEEDGPSEDMSHDSEEISYGVMRIASTRSCQRQEPQENRKDARRMEEKQKKMAQERREEIHICSKKAVSTNWHGLNL